MDKFVLGLNRLVEELYKECATVPTSVKIELSASLYMRLLHWMDSDARWRYASINDTREVLVWRTPYGLDIEFRRKPHTCNCEHCTRR